MQVLSHPVVQKAAILLAYAAIGAAVQAGYLPPEIKSWLADNVLEVVAISLGLGHILPEAAKRKPAA